MKKNRDGLAKNFEVVLDEWAAFWADEKRNFKRLIKPSLDPKNREHFVPHVLTAFISTFYNELPRTLTYLTILGAAAWVLFLLL